MDTMSELVAEELEKIIKDEGGKLKTSDRLKAMDMVLKRTSKEESRRPQEEAQTPQDEEDTSPMFSTVPVDISEATND